MIIFKYNMNILMELFLEKCYIYFIRIGVEINDRFLFYLRELYNTYYDMCVFEV